METKHKPRKKETTKNTAQQNYPGSVAFYHTRAHTGCNVQRITVCDSVTTGPCQTLDTALMAPTDMN